MEPSKKKVVFVIPALVKAGAERVVSLLSIDYAKRGYDVLVVAYGGEKGYEVGGRFMTLGIPQSLPRPIRKIANTILPIFLFRRLFRKEKPDIVVSFLSNIAPILTGYPLIVSLHTHYERLSFLDRYAVQTLYKRKNVRSIVVPSEGLRASFIAHGAPSTIVVIPNPIEMEPVSPTPYKDRTSIVAVGRLLPIKQFDALLRAFANASLPQTVSLVIVGDGPERSHLESLAQKLRLTNVVFTGQVDNPSDYMARARCLVMTSEMETFGNVLVEAMAVGTPVLSYDCDYGPREIINDGVDGILVPLNDEEELSRRMKTLYDLDEASWQTMSERASARAEAFSLSSIGEKWEALTYE